MKSYDIWIIIKDESSLLDCYVFTVRNWLQSPDSIGNPKWQAFTPDTVNVDRKADLGVWLGGNLQLIKD